MASPRTYLVDGSGTGAGGAITGADANIMFGGVLDRLQDNAQFWATVTSGGSEGDDITATIQTNETGTPTDTRFLERGLIAGMGVTLVWPAANTGAVTLAVNGGSALSIVTPQGAAIAASQLPAGLVVTLVYFDGEYVCLSPLPASSAGADARYYETFTSSGTWNKPAGLGDDTPCTVGIWGAGGGGGASFGGGGGSYVERTFRLGDLPSSVAITIGAGGATTSHGGNTTFGSLLTAYGGGGALNASGGGAGLLGKGGNNTAGKMGGGDPGGGDAALTGAGGGGQALSSDGGSSLNGGGGGAHAGAAGTSVKGGNGGTNGVAGSAPGGGGGSNAVGARGECHIWI